MSCVVLQFQQSFGYLSAAGEARMLTRRSLDEGMSYFFFMTFL